MNFATCCRSWAGTIAPSPWTRSGTAIPIRYHQARPQSRIGRKPRMRCWTRSTSRARRSSAITPALRSRSKSPPPIPDRWRRWCCRPALTLTRRGARRRKAHQRAVVDDVTPRMDGGHLAELWSMRQSFYPADRIDLLERFMVDALKAGPRAAEGHRAVDRHEMEKRLPLVRCPTLVIAPTADPHAYPACPESCCCNSRQHHGRDRKRHGAAAGPDARGIRRRGAPFSRRATCLGPPLKSFA